MLRPGIVGMHRVYGHTTTAMQDIEYPPFPAAAPQSASKAVLSRMQLTLHTTHPTTRGASRLVQD